MIDNLLLETTLPSELKVTMSRPTGRGRLRQVTQFDRVLGRNLTWTRAVGPGFWVGYQPDTHRCQVYLSVSRVHNVSPGRDARSSVRHLVNFPLHDFDTIDQMNLVETSRLICWALGLRASGPRVDYIRGLNLASWIVRRIAYAVDVEVPDVLPTIGALAGAKRKRSSEVQVRGRPGGLAHSATWTAGGVRVMLYSKGAELENRKAFSGSTFGDDAFGRAARSRLREAAAAARNVIRFEVTYYSLDSIRRLLGLESPMAPTFRLMAHSRICDYALALEVDRLRLSAARVPRDGAGSAGESCLQDVATKSSTVVDRMTPPESLADSNTPVDTAGDSRSERSSQQIDFRALYDKFLYARQQHYPEMSLTRLARVMMTHLLLTSFDRRELLRRGTKPSSLSKDIRDLARLGIIPGGSQPTVDQLASIDAFLDGLLAQVPNLTIHRPTFNTTDTRLVAAVPWAPPDESKLFNGARPDFSEEDFSDVLARIESADQASEPDDEERISGILANM